MSGRGTARLHAAVIGTALIGVLSVGSLSPARAVPLSGFTGNVNEGSSILNYAVLSPYDSYAGVLASAYVPAEGQAAFDASKYTYLYQVANISTPMPPATYSIMMETFAPNARLSTPPVSSTTVGSFASGNFRLDFLNNGSVVNATGNNLLGANSLGIAARTVSGAEVFHVGASNNWLQRPYYGVGVTAGQTTPLFGYQSSFGPTFTTGQTNYLLQTATGNYLSSTGFPSVPNGIFGSGTSTSAPEPSTILLIGSGALGLLAWQRTRGTKQDTLS